MNRSLEQRVYLITNLLKVLTRNATITFADPHDEMLYNRYQQHLAQLGDGYDDPDEPDDDEDDIGEAEFDPPSEPIRTPVVQSPATSPGVRARIEQLNTLYLDKFNSDANFTGLAAHTVFIEDLGMDSLDIIEFAMEVESEFGIEISDDDLFQLTTVGAMAQHIVRELNERE